MCGKMTFFEHSRPKDAGFGPFLPGKDVKRPGGTARSTGFKLTILLLLLLGAYFDFDRVALTIVSVLVNERGSVRAR